MGQLDTKAWFKWRHSKWKLRKARKGSPARMLTPKGKLIVTRKKRMKINSGLKWALGPHTISLRKLLDSERPSSFNEAVKFLVGREYQPDELPGRLPQTHTISRARARTMALAYVRGWKTSVKPKRPRGRPPKRVNGRRPKKAPTLR
jgi:hypothetical protein